MLSAYAGSRRPRDDHDAVWNGRGSVPSVVDPLGVPAESRSKSVAVRDLREALDLPSLAPMVHRVWRPGFVVPHIIIYDPASWRIAFFGGRSFVIITVPVRHTLNFANVVVFAAVLCAIFTFGGQAASGADAVGGQTCAVSLDPVTLTPGESFTIVGRGFGPNQKATLTLFAGEQFPLGSTPTDRAGAFTMVDVVPLDVTAGRATLTAASSGLTCSELTEVQTSVVDGASTSRRAQHLSGVASTNTDVLVYIALGVGVLAAGFAFVMVGRRRAV